MKKLTSGNVEDSIRARLPRGNSTPLPKQPAASASPTPQTPAPAAPAPAAKAGTARLFARKANPESAKPAPPAVSSAQAQPGEPRRFQFLPVFWTVASVMSFTINVILLVVLLIAFWALKKVPIVDQSLKQPSLVPGMATNIASGLLGGLYTNFVKMDEANIRTNIHVEKDIPVQFTLNVSGPTNVTLSQPVTIHNALVTVETGGLNIVNARATIVLPKNTLLPINIENLVVPVDQKVPAVLDVPVDIPLNQTELHEPFVGLQKVVEPWYCLIKPDVSVNGVQVCSQAVNPLSPGTGAP
jgi:hypothetical protein